MDKRQPASPHTVEHLDATCERCGVLFLGLTARDLKKSRDDHECTKDAIKGKSQHGQIDIYPRMEGKLPLVDFLAQRRTKPCWDQILTSGKKHNELVMIAFRGDAIRGGASDHAIHEFEKRVSTKYLGPMTQANIDLERTFGGVYYRCFDLQRRFPETMIPMCTGCPRDPRMFFNPHQVLEIGESIEIWFTTDQVYRTPMAKLHEFTRFQEWCGAKRNQDFQPTEHNKNLYKLMTETWRARAVYVDVDDLSDDREALDAFLRSLQRIRIVPERSVLPDSDRDHPLGYHDQPADELVLLNSTIREMLPRDFTFSRLTGLLKQEGLWAGKVKRTWIGKEKVALWRLKYSAVWPKDGPGISLAPATAVAFSLFTALRAPDQELDRDKALLAEAGNAYNTRTVMVDDQVWIPVHHLWYRVKHEGRVGLEEVLREFHLQGWTAAPESYEDVGEGPPVHVVKLKLSYFDPSTQAFDPGEDSGGDDPDLAERRRTWTPIRKGIVDKLRGDQDPGNIAVLNMIKALGTDHPQGIPQAVLEDAVKMSAEALGPVLQHYEGTGEIYQPRVGEWRAPG